MTEKQQKTRKFVEEYIVVGLVVGLAVFLMILSVIFQLDDMLFALQVIALAFCLKEFLSWYYTKVRNNGNK